jgi:hypothetical protein
MPMGSIRFRVYSGKLMPKEFRKFENASERKLKYLKKNKTPRQEASAIIRNILFLVIFSVFSISIAHIYETTVVKSIRYIKSSLQLI